MQICYKFIEKFLQTPKLLILGNKFVAYPMHCKDMLGFIDVSLDLLSQAGDVIINCSGRRVRVISPNLIKQLITGYDIALFRD
jgi:hypothetical protein